VTRAAVALFLAGCGFAATGDDSRPPVRVERGGVHYDVDVSSDLARFDVKLTFAETPPARLVLGDPGGLPWIATKLAKDGGGFVSEGLAAGATVEYRVDVAGMVEGGVATRVGRSVCARPGTWLLRAAPPAEPTSATLTLHLPDGDAVSAPWTRRDDGSWSLDVTAFRWRGFFAVGALEKHEIAVDGARLDVAVLDRPRAATWPGLEKWIAGAARAQTSLYGAFPVPRAQIAIKPSSSHQAAPFGETHRGGGHAVVLSVGDEAKDDAFAGDWVAVHEFAHLGLPAVRPGDAWFSEGFITYYQYVLMGRSGLVDERAAWSEMVAGFARGRRRGDTGRTLAEDSVAMESTHGYHRVYWGGAATAFLVDVELRRATGGEQSLDDAMREVRRAFAGRAFETSADEVVAHLDAWLGRALVSDTTRPLLASKQFPPVDAALARLGVVVEDGKFVRFDDAAPDAGIRRAIMGRR
jgi:hypothetical protein